MDLMKIGTQLFMNKMSGSSANNDSVMSALVGLLGNAKGDLDLGGIIAKMQGGDLAGQVSSWLGSGSNDPVGADQLRSLFGSEKISQFAAQLDTDEDSALSGLAEALPNMVDQGSPDGSLLDSLGGIGGLAGMASKLLK